MYSGIMQQAEEAVASALVESDTEARAALAEQLEAWVQQTEANALSPDMTRLREQSLADAPSNTGTRDSSAG